MDMITTSAATENSFLLGSPSPQNVSQVATQCLDTLRRFVERGQITQLVAFDVREPGGSTPLSYAGFYDYDHLEHMANDAAGFSGNARGVHFTLNPLNSDVLCRCPNRVQRAQKGILARPC